MINYQDTSRRAWHELVPISAKLDFAIMTALEEAGPAGLICQDIEGRLGRSHRSVSGNLRHLVEKGRVVATGEHGRTTSNRSAMKWRVAA